MTDDHLKIAAYVCCYNDAEYLPHAIKSLKNQSMCPAEILVIDDGSAHNSSEVAKALGATVITLESNLGRGNGRAVAMKALSEFDLIVSCDALDNDPAAMLLSLSAPHIRLGARLLNIKMTGRGNLKN